MATRVYLKGVTVFIKEDADVDPIRIPSGYTRYDLKNGQITIHDLIVEGKSYSFPQGDLQDDTGSPIADPDEYLSGFVGSFSKGGGDGNLGSQTPEEILAAVYVDEAAAIAGGLVSSNYYHTGDRILRIIS